MQPHLCAFFWEVQFIWIHVLVLVVVVVLFLGVSRVSITAFLLRIATELHIKQYHGKMSNTHS